MALKALTLVTNINNLSDARYCAGMGVDIISFPIQTAGAEPVSPAAVKEIAGWVAGVQVAGAFSGLPAADIKELAQACDLDFVQLEEAFLVADLQEIGLPVLFRIEISKDSFEQELRDQLEVYAPYVQYFLVESRDFTAIDETNTRLLQKLAQEFPLILGFGLDKDNVLAALQEIQPAGLALKGGHEIKPGLRQFDDLADILETLEEED